MTPRVLARLKVLREGIRACYAMIAKFQAEIDRLEKLP